MKTLIIAFLFLLASCGGYDDIKQPLDNYKGYVVVGKEGEWVSGVDLSKAYKVTLIYAGKFNTVFTTQYYYDKYCLGDTIK